MKLLPQDFIHPDDQAALNNLQSLPLFPECMKAFMRLGWEQYFHGTNMAQKIRLGPDQLPEIYRYLLPICDRLDIQEPELYLEMNPHAAGATTPVAPLSAAAPAPATPVAMPATNIVAPAQATSDPAATSAAPAAKFCTQCGGPLQPSARFCPQCGTKVDV